MVFFLAAMALSWFEIGIYLMKQSRNLNEKNLAQKPQTFFGKLGSWSIYAEISRSFLGILAISCVLIVLGYFYAQGFLNNKFVGFGNDFWAFLIGTFVYFLVKKPFMKFFNGFRKNLSGSFVEFDCDEDSLMINLDLKTLGENEKQYQVKIPFTEIDEIQKLSGIEADYYLKSQIGPDPFLLTRKNEELIKYSKGTVSYPHYYWNVGFGTQNVEHLLVKGQNLLYLVAYKNSDFEKLRRSFGR